jgi:glycosyltransferase 2 family protein
LSASKSRSKWLGWLRAAFAVAVLSLVFYLVPRTDKLQVAPEGRPSEAVAVKGEILGDWRAAEIRFRPEDGQPIPPLLASALQPDGTLLAHRASPAAPSADPSGVRVDWTPGMPRVFREMDRAGLVEALALFALGQLIVVTRWWRLLAAAGCAMRWVEALRLTGLGLFFNLLVPGLTGGDVVKAVLVTRQHPARKAHAFLTVVIDRLLGLLSMAVLASIAILLLGETFAAIRTPVLLFVGAGVVGAAVVSSRALRRALHFERWLARLPLGRTLQQLDEAVLLYSQHPVEIAISILLSFLNHLTVILGVLALGRAFGDAMPASNYFAIAPVATIVSALPVAPGGWGVGEATYSYLFELLGASAAVGLATSITFRLCQILLGLAGGLFLFVPGSRVRISEAKHLGAQA